MLLLVASLNFFIDIFGGSIWLFLINLFLLIIIVYFLFRIYFLLKNFLFNLIRRKEISDQSFSYFELIIPKDNLTSFQDSIYFFDHLHELLARKVTRTNINQSLSLEILSTKQGLVFLVVINSNLENLFKKSIESFLPEIIIKKFNPNFLNRLDGHQNFKVFEFKLQNKSIYPLFDQAVESNNLMKYLLNSMIDLSDQELIDLQYVIRPINYYAERIILRRILFNKTKDNLKVIRLFKSLLINFSYYFFELKFLISRYFLFKSAFNTRLSNELINQTDLINNKLMSNLFSVNIRLLIVSNNIDEKIHAINSALSLVSHKNNQRIQLIDNPLLMNQSVLLKNFRLRQSSILKIKSNILSSYELANLYYLPTKDFIHQQISISSISPLPLPKIISQRSNKNLFDITIGLNNYHDQNHLIGLTKKERQQHLYIIGGTGNGKSTLILNSLVQDINHGRGLALIDPHGDLAKKILNYIPKDRLDDVIYFNPIDVDRPIGINLLEQNLDLKDDQLLIDQDLITESVVSMFRKIFSDDDQGGHRIEHFLRNAIHTAFNVPDATIFTIYKLLNNTAYRKKIISQLTDQSLKDFWESEYNQAGSYQKVKMSSGLNAKIGRFERSIITQRILGQSKSTINFDEIIQHRKILICNLAKGQIGEDNCSLLGMSILVKLQLAALKRVNLDEAQRQDFYLYIDEFQNFANQSFVQILSEVRKYKLYLTIVEQSSSQNLDRRYTEIILANVGTIVAFGSASSQDQKLLAPIFSISNKSIRLVDLPKYNFLIRIRADKNLEPFLAQTILFNRSYSDLSSQTIIDYSRNKYGFKK